MSDSKLSDLTAATSVAPADLAYVVQGGTSKKATREILQTYDAGTLTADKKVLDLSATWNAAGVTFTGVKFNVTNTASASGSKVFDFQIGGSSAFVLDGSGNLGVGVTPSAWASTFKTIELLNSAFLGQSDGTTIYVGHNAYYDGSFWKRKAAAAVSFYSQTAGAHAWYTAASSTAGSNISFTEVLRITSAGLLTFGGTTSSFPALKRSSTTLQVRLADDSGDAPFSSGRATIDGLTVGLGGQTAVASNTAIGSGALNSASLTGGSNVAVGDAALLLNTSGAFNNALGRTSLVSNTTGTRNNAFGYEAMYFNEGGTNDSAFGHQALRSSTSGNNNSAFGYWAGYSISTASNNSALGSNALLYFNTSNNVAVGYEAVRGSTTVANNTGTNLVGVGYQALLNNTSGISNTAVGYRALVANTTGANNSAVGFESLGFNTTGQYNVAFGMYAFASGTTASNNVAVGYDSLALFSTNNNVAVGYRALKGGSATVANNTGANNIAIGYQAGDAITSGSNNIAIGYDIDVDSATGSSQINIGDRYFHDRIRLLERTSDPAKPAEGNMIVWMSDGTGLGDDGDVIIASTAGGVTNYAILFDHSAGTVWP